MLPRAGRLRRDRDFRAVYARGRAYGSPLLVLHVRPRSSREPGPRPAARVGFVISKKAAKRAHDRNRVKRRLREICRTRLLPRLRAARPVDMLFVVRAPAIEADFDRLAAEVDALARQAGLL